MIFKKKSQHHNSCDYERIPLKNLSKTLTNFIVIFWDIRINLFGRELLKTLKTLSPLLNILLSFLGIQHTLVLLWTWDCLVRDSSDGRGGVNIKTVELSALLHFSVILLLGVSSKFAAFCLQSHLQFLLRIFSDFPVTFYKKFIKEFDIKNVTSQSCRGSAQSLQEIIESESYSYWQVEGYCAS